MSYCHIISDYSMHSHVQRGNEEGIDIYQADLAGVGIGIGAMVTEGKVGRIIDLGYGVSQLF